MARRATSPSKKQTKAQTRASARMSEPTGTAAPRRGRKAKSTNSEPTEPSLTDIFFPGGEEPAEPGAEVGSDLPVKARRGRKPKAQPDEQATASMTADEGVQAESAPELALSSGGEPSNAPENSSVAPSVSPRKTRRRRDPQGQGKSEASKDSAAASLPLQHAAARWDADIGTATFDWPSIEQVAAADGPNQAMAKLLLAARAEGANSRWPF